MKKYRCIYCGRECEGGLDEKTGKYMMRCSKCGYREITKLGFDRYEAQDKLKDKIV